MTTIYNIGDEISVRNAAGPNNIVAAGAGDNAAVTGIIIDRAALGWPRSVVVAFPFNATLAAAATLSLAATVQHGDAANLSDAATFGSLAGGVIATGGDGGSTEAGQVELPLDLAGAKRYVRVNYTPDLSAGSTDTARLAAVAAFGGANRLPQ